MKKIIFSLSLLMLSLTSKSQIMVNNVDITNLNVQYIQLVGASRILNINEVVINVDYGQDLKWNSPVQTIKGPDGKNMSFESMIDALNYFDANGYDFVSRETVTVGQQNVYHYLLKRRK
jgi:hypothetical protein